MQFVDSADDEQLLFYVPYVCHVLHLISLVESMSLVRDAGLDQGYPSLIISA